MERSWARRLTALSLATGAALPITRRVQRAGAGRIVTVQEAPTHEVALVLGSPVLKGLTPILADRVETGVELWKAGRARRLLLSGNRGPETGDEVGTMAAEARRLGVPEEALLLDRAGRHTFESLASAKALGHRRLLVVSQRFHLPRALYIAQRLGLEAQGVPADRRHYQNAAEYQARELVSSVLAFWMAR
jgi:vancomycin permeability regulator SanA